MLFGRNAGAGDAGSAESLCKGEDEVAGGIDGSSPEFWKELEEYTLTERGSVSALGVEHGGRVWFFLVLGFYFSCDK